jgi:hypothetical protein
MRDKEYQTKAQQNGGESIHFFFPLSLPVDLLTPIHKLQI